VCVLFGHKAISPCESTVGLAAELVKPVILALGILLVAETVCAGSLLEFLVVPIYRTEIVALANRTRPALGQRKRAWEVNAQALRFFSNRLIA
jgi:hypothetical protein